MNCCVRFTCCQIIILTMQSKFLLSIDAFQSVGVLNRYKNNFTGKNQPLNAIDPCSIIDSTNSFLESQCNMIATPSFFIDPKVESSLLSDLAHLALDFTTFFSPNTAFFYGMTSVGRLLSIVSDYLPDHEIAPDELSFQIFMLLVSSRKFYESVHSIITTSPASFKDRRVYKSTFSPAGISWYQYRTIMYKAFEWVDMKPDDVIEDKSMYLLYRGEISKTSNGLPLSNFSHQPTNGEGLLILDEIPLVLELFERNNKKIKEGTIVNSNATLWKTSDIKIKAGPKGASLLRLDVNEFLKLIENDDNLALSFQNILLFQPLRRLQL